MNGYMICLPVGLLKAVPAASLLSRWVTVKLPRLFWRVVRRIAALNVFLLRFKDSRCVGPS